MKSKTLIGMAVASTVCWSAAAFAGSGHEVVTPFSPNETGEIVLPDQSGFGSSQHLTGIGSFLDEAGGTVGGGSSSAIPGEPLDQSAALGGTDIPEGMSDEIALADDAAYDYYLVSWLPVSDDTWDYYVIDLQPATDELSWVDEGYFTSPSDEVASDVGTSYDLSSFDMNEYSSDMREDV